MCPQPLLSAAFCIHTFLIEAKVSLLHIENLVSLEGDYPEVCQTQAAEVCFRTCLLPCQGDAHLKFVLPAWRVITFPSPFL